MKKEKAPSTAGPRIGATDASQRGRQGCVMTIQLARQL